MQEQDTKRRVSFFVMSTVSCLMSQNYPIFIFAKSKAEVIPSKLFKVLGISKMIEFVPLITCVVTFWVNTFISASNYFPGLRCRYPAYAGRSNKSDNIQIIESTKWAARHRKQAAAVAMPGLMHLYFLNLSVTILSALIYHTKYQLLSL